ncbi:hypothetical protein ACVOMS_15090 [Bradyrhizobium guangxiense]
MCIVGQRSIEIKDVDTEAPIVISHRSEALANDRPYPLPVIPGRDEVANPESIGQRDGGEMDSGFAPTRAPE